MFRKVREQEQTISILVNNQPGVLSRVGGVFGRHGYNIKSLCVAETTNPEVSRITLTSESDPDFTEKIKKQLEKLVDVIAVSDLSGQAYIQRELMLIGVTVKEGMHSELLRAIEMFGCKIVTMAPDYFILEITGLQDETAAVLKYFQSFGVEEINRTGSIVVHRNRPQGKI
ncbi:MAG: acetolactate synthase small subunit [Deltaproteobacteria bacterium]|nr:acetolactate synthase small subunit [Deltaproteobacteria bacterium]